MSEQKQSKKMCITKLRDLIHLYDKEEISISKFLEEINNHYGNSITGKEDFDNYYPGSSYQRLFNAISDTKGIATQDEMDEIVRIAREDFWASKEQNSASVASHPCTVGNSMGQGARVITIRWIDYNRFVANNLDGDLLFTGASRQEVEDWAVDHNYDIQEHRPVIRKANKSSHIQSPSK